MAHGAGSSSTSTNRPVLRGVPARPRSHRAAGHHRADLRHLPGRLPDQCLQRDRRRVRGDDRRGPARAAPAAVLRRVDPQPRRCTSTCCTRRTSSAIPTSSAWPRTPCCRRAGAGAEEGRQPADGIQLGGRAIHPVNVRLGGFYAVPDRADLRPLAEQLRRALDDALATVAVGFGVRLPRPDVDHEFLALSRIGPLRDRAGHHRREVTESPLRWPISPITSSSRRWRTRPRCTRPWTGSAT